MRQRRGIQGDRAFIKSSAKLFDVLEYYGNRDKEPGISLSQVASSLRYPKTTVHRLIYSLKKLGYLEQGKTSDTYRLGPRFFALVDGKVSYQRLKALARPIMEELAKEIRETVNLGALDRDAIVLIDVVDGPNAFRWVSAPGQREQIHATALGKAMAAFLPASEVEQLLKHKEGMARLTPRTITEPEPFLRELSSVRRDFVAFDDEEAATGVQCVASPIFDRTLTPVAALSISGPKIRMASQISKARAAVRDAALRISQLMGYQNEEISIAQKRSPQWTSAASWETGGS
jgi:DNA-binding IclR family transcriptional regulator